MPLGTVIQRSTLESAGSLVVTKTVNSNVVTVFGTPNCHVFGALVAPEASSVPLLYRKNGCVLPVNVPVPSALLTVIVPDPSVAVGPELKNTLTPPVSAVVPSAEFIGCTMRF